jgi:hypothetical protein
LFLVYLWRRHCLEVIHFEQCIAYVLTYYSKDSDLGRLSLQKLLYEGHYAAPSDKSHQYPARRLLLAWECFTSGCDYYSHPTKPTVPILGNHIPGQKLVLTSSLTDTLEAWYPEPPWTVFWSPEG